MNRKVRKIKFRSREGLIKGGLRVMRGSIERCPRDTSNLRSSSYVIWDKTGGKTAAQFRGPDAAKMKTNHEQVLAKRRAKMPAKFQDPRVEIGHTAEYAVYVHEDMEATHKIGEAKFLQHALEELEDVILSDVAMEVAREV